MSASRQSRIFECFTQVLRCSKLCDNGLTKPQGRADATGHSRSRHRPVRAGGLPVDRCRRHCPGCGRRRDLGLRLLPQQGGAVPRCRRRRRRLGDPRGALPQLHRAHGIGLAAADHLYRPGRAGAAPPGPPAVGRIGTRSDGSGAGDPCPQRFAQGLCRTATDRAGARSGAAGHRSRDRGQRAGGHHPVLADVRGPARWQHRPPLRRRRGRRARGRRGAGPSHGGDAIGQTSPQCGQFDVLGSGWR